MEERLFDWKECEEVDFLVIGYYDCTLNTDIGEYKKGDKVNFISIDYSIGIIRLPDAEFKLKLTLGNEI